jgi:uncharacterized phiE125 gp8 family phage protein
MDYTSIIRVKNALKITGDGDDALLATLVTAASRAIDRKCTGAKATDAADYFALEMVSDETLRAFVGSDEVIRVWPHKPIITAVSSLSYRQTPLEDWTSVATDRMMIDGGQVMAWPSETLRAGKYYVQLSYTGGYADDVNDLPADLVEAATVLAARYYREDESGLTDAVGIAEIGQMVYTKAMPVRVLDMLHLFERHVPW